MPEIYVLACKGVGDGESNREYQECFYLKLSKLTSMQRFI